MTTIAYRAGIIAYDSRATMDSMIASDTCSKLYTKQGVRFFCSGTITRLPEFAELYLSGNKKVPKGIDIHCFVWDGSALWRAYTETGIWERERLIHNYFAIGSGAHFALAAMDMGATAKRAVQIAAGRDTSTGGKIRVYKLEKMK